MTATPDDFCPDSSDELDWFSYFMKKSRQLRGLNLFRGCDIFENVSEASIDRFFRDHSRCSHFEHMGMFCCDLGDNIYKLGSVLRNSKITHWTSIESDIGATEAIYLFHIFGGYEQSGDSDHRH